jgi:hypothetical protein
VVASDDLEVRIEDLEAGRFEARGLPDEGPYALRLSASGELRGILSGAGQSLDLMAMLRQGSSLEAAFRTARAEFLPRDG